MLNDGCYFQRKYIVRYSILFTVGMHQNSYGNTEFPILPPWCLIHNVTVCEVLYFKKPIMYCSIINFQNTWLGLAD